MLERNSITNLEKKKDGVYFSANDVVYDWALAFLNSFRMFNPELRLLLIPFNDDCDRLLKLQDIYQFEIYTDPAFEQLEAIGQAFELGQTATGPYWFRRYAAFWGPCDRFMYLDARQVILASLSPIIRALDVYDFDLLHFDCAVDQVYEPSELRRSLLRQGKANGFNSGRWAARKGLFTLEDFEQLSEKALRLRQQLNLRNTDQAFINYCCDHKPLRSAHAAEVLGGICHTSWARQSGHVYLENGQYYLWDYGGLDHKKRYVLMHWAGYSMQSALPNRVILDSFRYRHLTFIQRKICLLRSFLFSLLQSLKTSVKSNRVVNQTYHRRIKTQNIFEKVRTLVARQQSYPKIVPSCKSNHDSA